MGLVLIERPIYQPVTLAEAKTHLRVVDNDDDASIALWIDSATNYIETFLGRALAAQTWELVLDSFPINEIKIPLPPLIQIIQVAYDDVNGVQQIIPVSDYDIDTANQPGWIVPVIGVGWPATFEAINAVRIRFRAGYTTTDSPPSENASAVPFDIKAALLLTLGTFFEHREDVIIGATAEKLPWGAEILLRQHRVQLGMQ